MKKNGITSLLSTFVLFLQGDVMFCPQWILRSVYHGAVIINIFPGKNWKLSNNFLSVRWLLRTIYNVDGFFWHYHNQLQGCDTVDALAQWKKFRCLIISGIYKQKCCQIIIYDNSLRWEAYIQLCRANMSTIRVTNLSSICRQNEYIIIRPTVGQESYVVYLSSKRVYNYSTNCWPDCHRLATGESQEGGRGNLLTFMTRVIMYIFRVWNLGNANIFGVWDFEDWKQIFVV